MLDRKTTNRGAMLFIGAVIGTEVYQYFLIDGRGSLGGDFAMPVPQAADLSVSLGLCVVIWLTAYLLWRWTRSNGPIRVSVPMSWPLLLLFLFNLALTVGDGVGSVARATKSPLSFLATMIPIQYLILVNAQQPRLNKKFFVAGFFLAIIDLYRLLLGALFKLGYITLMRANRKMLLAMMLALPLAPLTIQTLVAWKFEARGAAIDNIDEVVVDMVTARVAVLSTVHYMTAYDTALAEFCHRPEYSSPWLAAGLAVIPKGIFGLEYVKTYNNCLVEFHLSRSVADNSVNSPYLMTLYLEALSGPLNFFSYALLTCGLLFVIIKLANFLCGASGDIFKLWVIFEFMWTGNILYLALPLYFLSLLLFYFGVRKCFPRAAQASPNESIHGAPA